jgi:proteasome lid subunit RPN8/RPN11
MREKGASWLELSDRVRADIERATREARPLEACGLLLGASRGASRLGSAVRVVRNVASSPRDRFEIDPAEHLRVELESEALGLAVIGVWHSHPRGRAVPSELDRARAVEGWSHVIVGFDEAGAAEVRSWRLVGGELVEEDLSAR